MWGPAQRDAYLSDGDFGEVLVDLESQGAEFPCDKELAELLGWEKIPLDDSGDPYVLEGVVRGEDGREGLVFSWSQNVALGKDYTNRQVFTPTAEQLAGVRRLLEDRRKRAEAAREAAAKKEWLRKNFPRVRELETSAKTRVHVWNSEEHGKLLVLLEIEDGHGGPFAMVQAIFRIVGGDERTSFGLEKVESGRLATAIEEMIDRGDFVIE